MRGSWAAVAAIAALGACSDGTGPDPVIVGPLTLDFCATEAPVFFAYLNDGGDWTSVEGTGDASFTFDATERVAIAMTFDFGSERLTDIYYATRTELLPLSDRACIETFGGKTVNGVVANVSSSDSAVVTMGGAEVSVLPPPNTFSLQGVPVGPQDIVAHRDIVDFEGHVPDRVVILRAQNPTNNNSNPITVDFEGTSSSALTVNLASISGLTAGEDNYLDVFFKTALGTDHWLYAAPFFSTNSTPIYGVPAGLTQAGDLHQIELQAQPISGERYRVVRRWYRNPANQSLALGPTLNVPDVESVGSSPYLRFRASLQAQSEYDSFATAYFIQGPENDVTSVFVTHTAGFHGGTPATWRLEIPTDLDDAGWPVDARLVSGSGTQWFVEAFDGSLSDFIGATPTENATVRWAGRTSDVLALRALRGESDDSSERLRRRPALLDQGGFRR